MAEANGMTKVQIPVDPGAKIYHPDTSGGRVMIDYTNHRGERATRTITPRGINWGSTEWHPEPQWLLLAWDHGKNAFRDFAIKDIHDWTPCG
jgi:predicted DNA-binding transcriptional regulator YafY